MDNNYKEARCIKFANNPDECVSRGDCPIYQKGLCREFGKVLEKIESACLRRGMKGHDIDDLISRTTIGVLESIGNLRDSSKFTAWVKSIYRKKWNDFLRGKYQEENLRNVVFRTFRALSSSLPRPRDSDGVVHEEGEDSSYKIENQKVDKSENERLEKRKRLSDEVVPNIVWSFGSCTGLDILDRVEVDKIIFYLEKRYKGDDCAKLITDWYRGLKEGKTNKEIASDLDMIPNSFTVKLKRCIDKLRKDLGIEV